MRKNKNAPTLVMASHKQTKNANWVTSVATLRSPERVLIIPASSFLQGHDRTQQKVPTAIACAQLTKAAALFHYHKNAICGVCVGLLGWGLLCFHGRHTAKRGFYLLSYTQAAFITPPRNFIFFFKIN